MNNSPQNHRLPDNAHNAQLVPVLKPLASQIRHALFPGLLLGLHAGTALAGPAGGHVVGGVGNIARPNSTTTVINQQSHNLAIDWQQFNVKSNELVQFNQPGRNAQALNRIFDQNPSQIHGRINANGRVLLMNPNGVVFGPQASVNVNALVAAGMKNISVDDFMAGKFKLEALDDAEGAVINYGTLEAAAGGDITLVGKTIRNEGVIIASAGRVNLAAGNKVTLDFDGDGLMRFAVDEAVLKNATPLDAQITNSGTVSADGGDVIMTASAAKDVFNHAINNSGIVRAGKIENRGGKVRLVGLGPTSSVLNTGVIDASARDTVSGGGTIDITGASLRQSGRVVANAGSARGGQVRLQSTGTTIVDGDARIAATSETGDGGTVHLLGEQVGVLDSSLVDVSGANGGEILVGGDYQGKNASIQNASATVIGSNANLKANADVHGDGGKVIVWADDYANFAGNIEATGGSESGDGGFVETSGKDLLIASGRVDASAPNGEAGEWLLDPRDVELRQVAPSPADNSTGGTFGAPGATFTPTADTAIADIDQIVTSLEGGTNVTINTGSTGAQPGNITVIDAISVALTSAVTFALDAANDVNVSNTITATGDALTVILEADNDADGSGNVNITAGSTITTNGGDVHILGENATIAADVNAGAGDINYVERDGSVVDIEGGAAELDQTELNHLMSTGTVTIGRATAADGSVITASGVDVEGSITIASTTGSTFALVASDDVIVGDTASTTETITLTVNPDFMVNADIDDSGAGDFQLDDDATSVMVVLNGANNSVSAADVVFNANASPSTVSLNVGANDIDFSETGATAGLGVGDTPGASGFQLSGDELGRITAATVNFDTTGTIIVDNLTAAQTTAITTINFNAGSDINFSNNPNVFQNAINATADGSINVNDDLSTVAAGGDIVLSVDNDNDGAESLTIGSGVTIDAMDVAADASFFGTGTNDTLAGVSTVTIGGGVDDDVNDGTADGHDFTDFADITGTAGDDNFTFSGSASLTGQVDGAGDTVGDTADYSSATGVVTVTLVGSADMTTAGVKNVETVIGSGDDTLVGENVANTWTIGAGVDDQANDGTVGGVTFQDFANLTAGTDTDSFTVDDTATLSGTIDGSAAGTDTIDVSAYTAAATVNLETTSIGTGIVGDFNGIESFIGDGTTDVLVGPNAVTTWTIGAGGVGDGVNDGTVGTIEFEDFSLLSGGSANDTYAVLDAGSLTGGITADAGGVADTVDYSALTSGVTITVGDGTTFDSLTSVLVSAIEIVVGSSTATDTVTGTTGADTFTIDNAAALNDFSVGGISYRGIEDIDGGADNDIFNVSGDHTGNLLGNTGDDTFNFSGTATLTGQVDGGAAGDDTVDFGGYATSVSVTPRGVGAADVTSTTDPINETTAADDYINIENALNVGILGDNVPNFWLVKGTNEVDLITTSDPTSAVISSFTGITSVTGGTDTDFFIFEDDGMLTSVAGGGGAGVNTVKADDLTSAAALFTLSGTDSGSITVGSGTLTTTFSDIDTILGSTSNDTFNVTGGFAGTIDGAGGTTDLVNYTGSGLGRVVFETDVMDVDTIVGDASDTSFILAGGDTFTIAGTDDAGTIALAAVTTAFNTVSNIEGTAGDDNFNFTGTGTITGQVDGAGDTSGDTADYSSATGVVTVTLVGSADTTTAGVKNVETVIGSGDDTLVGENVANTWTIGAGVDDQSNDGTVGGVTFQDFANLTAGTDTDSFTVDDTATLSGTIDGSAAGTDTIDVSAYTAAATVNLETTSIGTGIIGDFNGIESFIGDGTTDVLVGPNAVTTWTIGAGGVGDGVNDGTVGTIEFEDFSLLSGGSANDTYAVLDAGSLTGGITADAGGVADTVDYSALTTGVTITVGDGTTFDSLTSVLVSAIEIVVGSSTATDTVTGTTGADTFTIDNAAALNDFSVGGISYRGIEDIDGGADNDIFNVSGDHTGNLLGNTGDDTFNFSGTATLTGQVDGGAAGNDTADFGGYATAVLVTPRGTGAGDVTSTTDPIDESTAADDYINVENVLNVGILGDNVPNFWLVKGTNEVDLITTSDPTSAVISSFTGISTVTGGTDTDFFIFEDDGMLTSVAGGGGAGVNTVKADDLTSAAAVFALSGTDSGSITVGSGTLTTTFSDIDTILGSTSDDTFNVTGGFAGTIDGSGGTGDLVNYTGSGLGRVVFETDVMDVDTIVGDASDTSFILAGGDTFTIAGTDDAGTIALAAVTTAFNTVSNIEGTASDDNFNFTGTGTITGQVDGAGDTAGDTADYSAATGTVTITLLNPADLTPGIKNIESVVGSGDETLVGTSVADTFNVTGNNAGNVTGLLTSFTGISDLDGAGGDDFFIFTDTFTVGSVTGGADSSPGGDTLDLSNYSSALTWTISSSSSVTGIGFSGVEFYIGGTAADDFVVLDSGTLDLTGADPHTVDGGTAGPVDTLSFAAKTSAVTVEIANLTNIDTLIGGSTSADILIGTGAADTFFTTATDAGCLTACAAGNLTYASFESLDGAGGGDIFNLDHNVTNSVTGGAGDDQFLVQVNSISVGGGIFGGDNNDTFRIGAATEAGDAADVAVDLTADLDGGDGADVFTLTGPTAVPIGGSRVIGNVIGGDGGDTLNLGFPTATPATAENNEDSRIVGMVDLGAGSDTLDFSGNDAFQSYNVTSTDGDGSNGTLIGFGPDFGVIDLISGGFMGVDTQNGNTKGPLVGDNISNTWIIDGLDSGTLNGTPFTNFLLVGGTMDDSFEFQTNGRISGGIDGGLGIDTVSGQLAGAGPGAIVITGALAGTVDGDTTDGEAATSFINIETLLGGSGDDVFSFGAATTAFDGQIDGQAGTDTLDFSVFAGPRTITLTALGGTDGYDGNEAALNNDGGLGFTEGFKNIDNIVGSGGADTIIAPNTNTFFYVNGANSGTISDSDAHDAGASARLTFSGMQNLIGGTADDEFEFSGASGTLSGNIDGDLGDDKIDLIPSGVAGVTVRLNDSGTLDGRLGTATGVTAGFDNINAVDGRALDTLQVNTPATTTNNWRITGVDTFTLDGSTIPFTGFGGLSGGAGPDIFTFDPGGQMTGGISGAAGNNTIIGSTSSDTVSITAANTGSITIDDTGAALVTAFTNIQNVDGSDPTAFDTLDYSGFGAGISVSLITGVATGITSFTNFENFVGNAAFVGSNRLFATNTANLWDLTADNAGTINPGPSAVMFSNIGNLEGGSLADTFDFSDSVSIAGVIDGNGGTDRLDYADDSRPTLISLAASAATGISGGGAGGFTSVEEFDGGTSGANILLAGAGDDSFTVDAANSGMLNGNAYNTFQSIGGGAGNDVVTINAGGSIATLISGGVGNNTLRGSGFVNVWDITANNAGTLNGNSFISFANLVAIGTDASLTQSAGVGLSGSMTANTLTVDTAAITTGGNPFNVVGDLVSSSAAQSITSGDFTVSGDIIDTGTAFTISATGAAGADATVGGFIDVAALSLTSNTSFTSRGITSAGALTIDAGGPANVNGTISAASLVFDSAGGSVLTVATTGTQTYTGTRTFNGGNITGSDLVFNGVSTFVGDSIIRSSTNVFDFNGPVGGTGNIDIVPTSLTDITINTGGGGPGNLAANQFTGFTGHLIVGAELDPLDSPAQDAVVVNPPGVTANRIVIDDEFIVGGDVTLIGSNIDLNSGVSGGPFGQVTLIAVGDSQGNGGEGPGDITGPEAGTSVIGGGSAVLVANNGIVNAGNLQLDLNGGDLFLAVSADQDEPEFDASSNASSVDFDPTTVAIIASLGLNLQSVQVVFTNPASALTGLQNVQYIDDVLFEDFGLFGVIGTGTALPLSQCEEAEGCAPNVTEEEVIAIIEELKSSIASLQGGDADQLSNLQRDLALFEQYQSDLEAFNAAQDDFGDDFSELDDIAEEFDDAPIETELPAEETTPQFAAPEPEPEAEPLEEAFEELEDEFVEEEIPVDEFEDLEEEFEEPAPAVEEPEFEELDDEFEELDDEFEELSQPSKTDPLLQLTANTYANEYLGSVDLNESGRVVWTGEIVLPATLRAY